MNKQSQPSQATDIGTGRLIPLLPVRLAALAGLVLLLGASRLLGQNRLCVPNTASFTPPSPAPVIDGVVAGDPGWQPAFQADLGGVVVQGVRDTNNLYLSVQASSVDSIGSNTGTSNLVLLTFDSGGGGAGPFQQIQILPVVANAMASYSGPSGPIKYWVGSLNAGNVSWTIFNPPGPVHAPPWLLTGNVKVSYPDNTSWALEMALPFSNTPSSGLVVPSTGFFDLYIDVFRVVLGALQQSSFPPNQLETSQCAQNAAVGTCTPDASTPSVASWGSSTLGSACRWVTIQNISVTNATNNNGLKIDLLTANTFNALVNNTVPDGTLPTTAKQVSAEFVIANFGLPSPLQWQPVPTTHNPKGPADLPSGPTTLSPDSWTVPNNSQPPPNQRSYDPTFEFDPVNPSHPHQCIQVKLTTPDTSTAFTNSPSQQNMEFVQASRVVRRAEVNGQYPPRLNSDGSSAFDQLFDLLITSRQETLTKGHAKSADAREVTRGSTPGEKGGARVVSRLIWVAEGCRHTGRYMTINERKLELCDPVGKFGYVVRHAGITPVRKWNPAFTGPGLEKVPGTNNAYRVHVPNDGVARVDTKFEPSEERLAIFLDAGGGFPQGNFKKSFNNGFSLNAGLEYIIASYFSAEGIFGYHHFPAKVGSNQDIYQFSVNAKFYLRPPASKVRPFINAGPGGYVFSPGSTNFGGNVGGGFLFELTSRFGLQASYNFHAVNTAGGATEFSTVQGGFRLAF